MDDNSGQPDCLTTVNFNAKAVLVSRTIAGRAETFFKAINATELIQYQK